MIPPENNNDPMANAESLPIKGVGCGEGSAPTEYLRRNLVIAKACGLKAEIKVTTQRLRKMNRVPKWLFASLTAMHERASDLPSELAQWRDASPDSPFPPNIEDDRRRSP